MMDGAGRRRRVVILGSLNTDFSVLVPTLPRAGETVLGEGFAVRPGGKGGNQAVAAARLGAEVSFVGRVGADGFGDSSVRALADEGVDVSGVTRAPSTPTGTALILVGESGENMIVVAPGANGVAGGEDIDRLLEGLIPGDIVLLQLEIPHGTAFEALRRARLAGAVTVLNAAPVGRLKVSELPRVDVLIVNATEATQLTGVGVSDGSAAQAAASILLAAADRVVITLGANGASVSEPTGTVIVAAFEVHAVDATGAGDAFCGALAFGLAAGLSTLESVRLGAAAGAATAAQVGARTALPTAGGLRERYGLQLGAASAALDV